MKFYQFIILAALLISCEESDSKINTYLLDGKDTSGLNYDFNSPDQKIDLPMKLREISGLSFNKDETEFVVVNDEKAKIYFLEKNSGQLISFRDFGRDGDYEGVAFNDSVVYVVKSTGTLYEYNLKTEKTNRLNNYLKVENDIEGLELDKKNNRLLLAAKGKSNVDQSKHDKDIYQFDLDTKILKTELAYKVYRDSLLSFFDKNYKLDKKRKSKTKRLKQFAPSGVAVHTPTNKIFLISTQGKLLVVLDPDGEIAHIAFLDSKIFKQPEGICFDSDSNLYISNEGRTGQSNILKFKLIK